MDRAPSSPGRDVLRPWGHAHPHHPSHGVGRGLRRTQQFRGSAYARGRVEVDVLLAARHRLDLASRGGDPAEERDDGWSWGTNSGSARSRAETRPTANAFSRDGCSHHASSHHGADADAAIAATAPATTGTTAADSAHHPAPTHHPAPLRPAPASLELRPSRH